MSARLTVVGSGFAGMTALRTLRRQDRDAELTLVAPAAELHYLPGTIWLPSGKRTRVGMRTEGDGRKVRVSRRKDGGVIDK